MQVGNSYYSMPTRGTLYLYVEYLVIALMPRFVSVFSIQLWQKKMKISEAYTRNRQAGRQTALTWKPPNQNGLLQVCFT